MEAAAHISGAVVALAVREWAALTLAERALAVSAARGSAGLTWAVHAIPARALALHTWAARDMLVPATPVARTAGGGTVAAGTVATDTGTEAIGPTWALAPGLGALAAASYYSDYGYVGDGSYYGDDYSSGPVAPSGYYGGNGGGCWVVTDPTRGYGYYGPCY